MSKKGNIDYELETYAVKYNSPSLAKLYKCYKSHLMLSMAQLEDMVSMEEFYWEQRRLEEIPKSLTFEKYIRLKRYKKSK